MNQISWLGYPLDGYELKNLLGRHGAQVIYDIDHRIFKVDLPMAGFKLFFNRKNECCSILVTADATAAPTFDPKHPDRVKLLGEIGFWTSKKSVKAFADRCEREILEDNLNDSSRNSLLMTISFEEYKYHYIFEEDTLRSVELCLTYLESEQERTASRHLRLHDAIHGMTLCRFFELFCEQADYQQDISDKASRELHRFICITFYLYKHNSPSPSHRVDLNTLYRYLRWARDWDEELTEMVISRIQTGYDLLHLHDIIDVDKELKQMPL